MSAKINSNYVENYAREFGGLVCADYFKTKKYMTGQDIITLTPSIQVNFFIIKILFETWQLEIEKLKSSPFFDYRDKAVHESLREFANLLSRTIKIERQHFEPLLVQAVKESISLAVNPLDFFKYEIAKVKDQDVNQFLKDNKKYIKWHNTLIASLIDRAGLQHTREAYTKALENNFLSQKANLESYKSLLNSMGQIKFLDFDLLTPVKEEQVEETPNRLPQPIQEPTVTESFFEQLEETSAPLPIRKPVSGQEPEMEDGVLVEDDLKDLPSERKFKPVNIENRIDPLEAWNRLENEQYSVMKGTIKDLAESVGLNQRFMFTKELFDGNPDLLKHALRSIDECKTFVEAIELLNERYVGELGWNKNSEIVDEFVQLIFRKFDSRG
jgi:hypothetical protein